MFQTKPKGLELSNHRPSSDYNQDGNINADQFISSSTSVHVPDSDLWSSFKTQHVTEILSNGHGNNGKYYCCCYYFRLTVEAAHC